MYKNLIFNPTTGFDGAAALVECLKSCIHLQTLNLCSNNIGSDGEQLKSSEELH